MVLEKAQNTVSNLKDRPKDERKVIAGGIAISVVVVLFFAWAILFLKNIQSGSQDLDFSGAGDAFLNDSIRESQSALERNFSPTDELEAVRRDASTQQSQQQSTVQQFDPNAEDAFGAQVGN